MDNKTGRCGTNTCVEIESLSGGEQLAFTSSISPTRGKTVYDRAEIVAFFADVKAGKWDHLLGDDCPARVDHSAMVA